MQNLVIPGAIAGATFLLARYAGVLGTAFFVSALIMGVTAVAASSAGEK